MDARKIILLVGALVVAAITAFMARTMLLGSPAPVAGASVGDGRGPVAVSGVEVLVATKALPVGTILGPDSMKFIPWPQDLIEGAYFKREGTDLKALQGTVVRYAIPAGQPLTQGALVKPGDRGFLAAALGAGMRAVTVPVSAQSAVAGFVFPGDRVDLILTQSVPGGGDGPPLKASETVLRNLRVLATDQKTDKKTDDQGNTVVNTYSTVTVEATPRIAEKIAVAQTIGSLSLSLRSIADNAGDLEAAIAAGEVTMPADPKAEKALLARVAASPAESGSTMSTGADVSRFQRSTVPGKPQEQRPPMAGDGSAPQGGGGYPGNAGQPIGPVVKVARGNAVTVVPVGGTK